MNFLKRNPDYMAIATDKGLGAALIERTTYNNKLWSEHLSGHNAYRKIPPNQIHAVKVHMKYKLGEFFSVCQKILLERELAYFSRLRDQDGDSLISKFYMLAKVHKTPWKTRSVVATCDTIWHGISRWADHYLKYLSLSCLLTQRIVSKLKENWKNWVPSHQGLS